MADGYTSLRWCNLEYRPGRGAGSLLPVGGGEGDPMGRQGREDLEDRGGTDHCAPGQKAFVYDGSCLIPDLPALVEQNARMALKLAHRAYIMELGSISLEGDGPELANNDRVKKAYLGG